MIISKNALKAVDITTPDKQVPVLDTLHIREDGGVIAANRDCVLLVAPVKEEIKNSFPVKHRESQAVTLTAESIRDIIKYIGNDRRFGGLLEHCDVLKTGDKVEVVCFDGKSTKVLEGKEFPEYFNYTELLKRVHSESINVRVTVNRKRLKGLIDTIDKICDDKGDFSPIFLEFTNKGDMILRSMEAKHGTRVMAVARHLPGLQYVDYSAWEKQFLSKVDKVGKDVPVRNRYTVTNDFKTAKEEIMAAKDVKVFVRERKKSVVASNAKPVVAPTSQPVQMRKRNLPGQWMIMPGVKCPKCGNSMRQNEKGHISCSYVKCEGFSKYDVVPF